MKGFWNHRGSIWIRLRLRGVRDFSSPPKDLPLFPFNYCSLQSFQTIKHERRIIFFLIELVILFISVVCFEQMCALAFSWCCSAKVRKAETVKGLGRFLVRGGCRKWMGACVSIALYSCSIFLSNSDFLSKSDFGDGS